MDHWDEIAIDYLIAQAKDGQLSKARRRMAEHRLFRYMATMRTPKATKAQLAANARVINEAARADAIDVVVLSRGRPG